MLRTLLTSTILGGALLLSGCLTKSEDGAGGSVDMALLQGAWDIQTFTVNIAIPGGGSNILAMLPECDQSVITEFKSGGIYTQTPDPDMCYDEDEVADATTTGTYTVSGNTVTVVEADDDTSTFTVVELTATKLKMTEQVPGGNFPDNQARVATYTYTPAVR